MLIRGEMRFFVLMFVFSLLAVSFISSATISGSIYDYNLAKVENSVISINTSPEQVFVIESGEYSIELATGKYVVHVSKLERAGLIAVDEAIFDVRGDGVYTHDFILFEEIDEIELPNLGDDKKGVGEVLFRPVLIIIGVLIVVVLSFLAWKAQKEDEKNPLEEEDELLKEIMYYIKKQKRVSQKDVRKRFPYSESAVSMIITQLQNEGYVKKIKKGRGNILVWLGRTKKE